MIVAERNRLEHALPAVCGGITQHIHWLERQLQDVDRDLDTTLNKHCHHDPSATLSR